MKNLVKVSSAFVLAISMVFGSCGLVTAMAAENTQKTIAVNGVGNISVKPDTAVVNAGVITSAKDAKTAQSENAKIMKDVMAKLKEIGIKDEDIKTNGYSVYPEYSYDKESGASTIIGYNVRNMVDIKTKDIDNTAKIVDGIVSAGANINQGVRFFLEDESKYYSDALKLAVKNAEISAQAISSSLGVTLSGVTSVVEESGGYSYRSMTESATMDMGAGGSVVNQASTNITYDNIEISARVQVVYGF